jgi:hypothetical protein
MRFQNRCHRGKALHQIRAVFETLFDVAALWKMREPLLLIRVSPTARLLQSSPNRCAFTHNLIDSHKCSMERHCPHGDRCRLARFNPPLDRMLKIAKRHAAAPSATPSASESEPEPEDRECICRSSKATTAPTLPTTHSDGIGDSEEEDTGMVEIRRYQHPR